MKFCENLQKLRKSKNISQEQLAEMLGVTRQSVSKWESGASYPEMEKLTEMCRIFHCSLDSLVNGDAMAEQNKSESNLFHSFIQTIEMSIKKTIAMLENMNASQVIKFVMTLFLISIIIFACKIPFMILENSINSIFLRGYGNVIMRSLASTWSFLLNLAYGIFAILAFCYIYKVKYLDRVELLDSEGDKVKLTKEEVVITNEKKQVKTKKYVYQDHSGIFDFLTTLIIYFLKFMCGIILFCDLCALVTAIILFAFLIILAFQGLFLIGPILIGVGVIAFTILVAILLIHFIVDRKTNQVASLITFFTSIALGCVGFALSCWYFAGLTYVDGIPSKYQKKTVSEVYDMNENLTLQNHYNVSYVADDSLSDQVRVDIEYYYDHSRPKVDLISERYITYHREYQSASIYPKEVIDDIIKNLKQKKVYTYDYLFETKMIITSSKENIEKIKANTFDQYHYGEDEGLEVEEEEDLDYSN